MVIAIVGGGNIGTLLAGELAAKGHVVRVVTSAPTLWADVIDVLDSTGRVVVRGQIALTTDDLGEAVSGADYVWITYPSFMLKGVAQALLPFVEPNQRIGVVPGNSAEFYFAEHVRKGAVLFGLQRAHSIARLKEKGRSVYLLGRKPEIQVASQPSSDAEVIAREVEALLEIPTVVLAHYLVETLTPSNPLLHTARIRSMFRNWQPGEYFDRNILFYEEWDDAASDLLLACDGELQHVCRCLESELGIDLAQVKSLKDHYESFNVQALTAKISSIPAFKGLASPMREASPGKWEPDFSSRYFHADFAYGLKVILDIAGLSGAQTPCMGEVLEWYKATSGARDFFDSAPSTLEELALLYA